MEMDIPDIDELQWLEEEANSHLLEQEEEEYYQLLEPEVQIDKSGGQLGEGQGEQDAEQFEEFEASPPPPPPQSTGSKKRHRSPPSDLETAEDNRVRVRTEVPVADTLNAVNDFLMPSPRGDISVKYLSQFASEIDGVCMPVTAPGSGERVYAKLDRHVFSDSRGDGHGSKFKMPLNSGGLISEPVSVLLQKAEHSALMKALQVSSEVSDNTLHSEGSLMTDELWVNKYAPKSFTELLSDEHTNREVLFWLKQWDSSIFGTDIRNTGDEVLSALRRHSSVPHNKKLNGMNFMRKNRGPRSNENYMGHSAIMEQERNNEKSIPMLQNKKLNGSGPPDPKRRRRRGSQRG